MTKLQELARFGQAVWFDNISRDLLESGGLQALVATGVMGVTSNPSIFEKAIAGSTEYDQALGEMIAANRSTMEVYEALVMDDIGQAADVLRQVYDRTGGIDGYVSLEVNPTLADDTEGTVAEARRLFAELGRPNVMIKVPATPAGIPAIEALIGEGINVNATLMFSVNHYDAVAGAYLAGLERLSTAGGDLSKVASVASFFVSRVDTAVDLQLAKLNVQDLQGQIAIANAKLTYARFKEVFCGERWERLAAQGARVQRPLWASTGTKNPNYSDTLYVDWLIGPHTVNTVPPATLTAFLDHGRVSASLERDLDQARDQIGRLVQLGIDLDAITEDLQVAGVEAFATAFRGLLSSVEQKRAQLQGALGG